MATMLNPNAIPDGSITSAKLDKAYAIEENLPPLSKGTGENSVQMNNCTASGTNSFAEGDYTFSVGNNSHAEGNDTYANNTNSHAEGNNTFANGDSSHAEGLGNTASGRFSHVEGSSNQSIGESSHAEGNETEASGDHSHSEGRSTIAKGEDAHAEGCASQAKKACSHAEGSGTIADGDYSHSEGLYTKTSNEAEHAEGKYNLSTLGKTMHSVGIGEADDTRMNAFEIFNDGSVLVKGVGGYDGTNGTSAKTIQTVIGEKQDKAAFESHEKDNTRHITAAERTAWNAKQDALTAGFGISIYSGEISSTLNTNPFIVVSSLPSSGEKDKIYIAPSKNPETGNLTDEWIWNGSAWELLGASKVDLSDYATESWVENKGYLTEHQDISGKADVSYVDNKISTLTNVVNGKQDNISDLTAIRNGATLGSTAIQEETDPTVPAWAKAEKKPSYTPSEIGAASQEALQSHTKDAVVHITATERTKWNAKQDIISDLATIRSGAAKGATALQSYTETDPVYTADKSSLALKSEIPDISVKANVTDLTAHTGNKDIHVTASDKSKWNAKQDAISDLDTIRAGASKGATALQSYTEKYTGTITGITMNGASKGTSGVVNLGTVITEHQDISGKADKSSLAAVATSGSYNDLSNKPTIPSEQVNADWNATSGKAQILNKPTIPSAVTESTVSGWGFTKNTGTYSKPSTGIPKSDLESAVQTSLGKADTALQSYTEQYKGTITGVSANGTSVATSGVANIPAASTSVYGVTKLSSATNSTSTSLAATASAVKAAYDLANSYKGTVTGVKINGTTENPSSGVVDLGTVITDISGKQDIISDLATIRSGAAKGATALQSYTETDPVYTADKPNIAQKIAIVTKTSGATSYAISPNKITQLGTLASSVTISLNTTEEETGFINIYDIIFTTPSAAPSITWPEGITWVGGSAPAIAGGKTYEVSIMNGLATYGEF